MVKLVLVGGVYKPPKLENFGLRFYPQGFWGGALNGGTTVLSCAAIQDPSSPPFEVPPQNMRSDQ